MKTEFWRTGVVDISDAELILLDAFADNGALPFRFIRDPVFPRSFNRCSHGIDDVTLQLLLARWLRKGWLQTNDAYDGRRFGLTPLSLELWERERHPDWSRFVEHSERILWNSPERRIKTYLGASKPIVEALYATWLELEDVLPLRVRRLQFATSRARLHPVKVISPLVAIVALKQERECFIDWERYEQARCWWQHSVDLMRWRGRVP